MEAELFHADGHGETNSRFSQLCERAQNTTFCSHKVFLRLLLISGEATIIFLHDSNLSVFMIETERAYCAVRDEPIDAVQFNFYFRFVAEKLKLGQVLLPVLQFLRTYLSLSDRCF